MNAFFAVPRAITGSGCTVHTLSNRGTVDRLKSPLENVVRIEREAVVLVLNEGLSKIIGYVPYLVLDPV